MQGDTPQVPTTQEAQPEIKDVSQTPQPPPVVPQTPPEPTIPTKPKKWLKLKILIILLVLIGLGAGGFFVWKNISVPEDKKEETPSMIEGVLPITEEKLEKEGAQSAQSIPELAFKSKFGYMAHHADWQTLQVSRGRYSYLSWERAHPGFANWQEIEPKEGEYHWEMIDQYVRTGQEKDIQMLFTVWPFTDWDQENCNLHLEWQPNDWGKDPRDFLPLAHRKGKPCDIEAYKEFLRRLVERYDGDGSGDIPGLRYTIKYWEIGNEPDGAYDPKLDGLFFQGSAEDYFEILKVSYITIKEADPNAMVLITALPSLGIKGRGPQWKRPDFDPEKVFELGAAEYFDILNTHSLGRAEKLKNLLLEYNVNDKPIWVTEPAGLGDFKEPVGAEEEEELKLALIQLFEDDLKNNATKIFIGGPEYLDPALHKAINHIESR